MAVIGGALLAMNIAAWLIWSELRDINKGLGRIADALEATKRECSPYGD